MKNIRIIYIITIFTLIGLYTYSQFRSYDNIRNEVINQLEYHNTLYAKTIHSSLHEIELLLDSLGRELLRDNLYLDVERSEHIMQTMLDQVDFLVGFGLTDPEGNYIVLSSGINKQKVSGLQENPKTKVSFERTLMSKKMVIGSVYFFEGRDQWIIPLRKTLRNETGKIIGVMTTGISIEEAGKFFENDSIFPEQISLLLNDADLRRILVSPLQKDDYARIYSHPINRAVYGKAIQQIAASMGISEESLRETETPANYVSYSEVLKKKAINSVRYDRRYSIWVITFAPQGTAKTLFMKEYFFLKLIIFVFAIVTFTFLFRTTFRREEDVKKELIYQAQHDSLTNLYNRSALNDIASHWIYPNAPHFALFYVDLDNFKNLNDTFGHSYGDNILLEVGERFRNSVPDGSAIFRIGGDEFGAFLRIEDEEVENLAERLIHTLSKPYMVSGLTLHVGASIGISRFPEDSISLEKMLIMADLAMYEAKKRRNSYSFYNTELHEAMERKTSIEYQLRQALNQDEMFMTYQPQIRKDGTLHGAEALVRWNNKALGYVPPDQFISVAEETGLMPQLGKFIIDRSCEDFKYIVDQCGEFGHDMSISINISVKQFLERDFKQQLTDSIASNGLKTSQIMLEITESLFMDELDYILPLLKDIRDAGLSISLDDFGTGYSSLSMLRTLPIDELKIDRSFIHSILEEEQDSKMAHSIIDMGQTMNMKVVAEGVEEIKQFELLNGYGCDLYQGYYFSPPLPADEFITFAKKNYCK